jgi:hypothetical protein
MKIYLSYSSLNQLHNSSHEYLNKLLGAEVPEIIYLTEGKVGHRIIQAHVSGKKKDSRLSYLNITFPIVEERDFDDRLRFVKTLNLGGVEYIFQGFADGLNPYLKQRLEIKLSSTPWSIGKFEKSYQRKLYVWFDKTYKDDYLITGPRDPNVWDKQKLELMHLSPTDKDVKDAEDWVMKGIALLKDIKTAIKNREKSSGLSQDGKCINRWCLYSYNCQFK